MLALIFAGLSQPLPRHRASPDNGVMKTRRCLPVATLFLASACQFGSGPEGGRGQDRRHAAVTHLKSSVLQPLAKAAAASASASEVCDFGRPCLTPLNLEGRIRSGNLMVGGNGGPPGVPVRIVEGYDTASRGPGAGRGGSLMFNLGRTTDLAGSYACCGDDFPPDDLAKVHRLEFLFDYLDATFRIPADANTPLAGRTYTVRLVYVDTGYVEDLPLGRGAVHLGDKLIKREGEDTFNWCTESGCIAATRPDMPLRTAWHADTAHMAYPHYYTVGVSLKTPMPFTRTEADSGAWKFTVDWDLARAAVFQAQDFSQLTTEARLVAAFDLLSGFGGPGGIGVFVDLTKAPINPRAPIP